MRFDDTVFPMNICCVSHIILNSIGFLVPMCWERPRKALAGEARVRGAGMEPAQVSAQM